MLTLAKGMSNVLACDSQFDIGTNEVGPGMDDLSDEGLREPSEAACDALITLPKSEIDTARTGFLDEDRISELDRAIARALDIRRAYLPPA
jgi:hypothetical protein